MNHPFILLQSLKIIEEQTAGFQTTLKPEDKSSFDYKAKADFTIRGFCKAGCLHCLL